MGKKIKDIWIRGSYHNVAFWACLAISAFLILSAFFIPPKAVVDSSVIACVGELFGFAALGAFIKALDKGVDASVRHGDTELTLSNPDENSEPHHTNNHRRD